MITSLILCTVSAVFFVLLYYGKRIELNGGRQLIRLGSSQIDHKLTTYYEKQKEFLSSIDRAYMSEKLHQVAEKAEHGGMVVLEKIINKFGRAKDMVTGKDLPKNRGAVSFFLKHIESHKRNMKTPTAYNLAVHEETANEKGEAGIDQMAIQVKMSQVEEIYEGETGLENGSR